MSIVGNFNMLNHDREDRNGGAPPMTNPNRYYADITEVEEPGVNATNTASSATSDTAADADQVRHEAVKLENEGVVHLARQLTRTSTRHHRRGSVVSVGGEEGGGIQPTALFNPEKDSELDPFGNNFNPTAWARSLLTITSKDANILVRTAGIAFSNLSVHGYGTDTDYQATVGNLIISHIWGGIKSLISSKSNPTKRKVEILKSFDGILEAGEMLVVLGPPGSGCSTLLKTIAGELNGIYISDDAYLNYQGITPKQMRTRFMGEAIYTAEVDVHFPQLTVGETLAFAAKARAPRNPPGGISRKEWSLHLRDVFMSIFGISHTINTKVGNDYVRGVSGGERKRVSIAEAALSMAPLQCWDNSTRGLDSANAVEFCKTLKLSSEVGGTASVVAIYQAPQTAYDVFDKVSLIYQGEQIYFGSTKTAKAFFVDMGFFCPEQQTTPDFLTSLTSAAERRVQKGWENKVPKTPQEFAAVWKASETYAKLRQDLDHYDQKYPVNSERLEQFQASRRQQQSKHVRASSPYTLSYHGQIKLCLERGFQRLKADPSLTLTQLFGNFIMSLIVSSVFFNMPFATSSFYQRGSLLFFAILLNAFGSALEILTLYAQRPIVEKHKRYAFYHPSAEAFASMLTDMPYKICNAIIFNTTLYFMTNLRREPGAFFFFMLISFFLTLTMSMLFRSIASLSRSLSEALAPAAVLILGLVMYTGFAIPTTYMLGWSRWINYLNPIAYGFESLMINEFHSRDFPCSAFVPAYPDATGLNHVCSTVGSVPGSNFVNGDAYIGSTYDYQHSHKWRNFGILIAFMVALMCVYLGATELISAKKSKGEVLVFQRGKMPKELKAKNKNKDVESGNEKGPTQAEELAPTETHANVGAIIKRQTAIFHWQDVCYDIKIKKEPRRLLDHVDGWVKPGTLTALMGVSGAGKTTLLDVLATRVTMGVVSGEMLVDGSPRDVSFQRKTGYVQQQDLHLSTSTVREALRFSAILRQPAKVPKQEKLDYVEEVIKLLEMEKYAEAVVGVPGEGLNVEQRKRLTIGVELVAKPDLLLFLDEPTSGLDSQTSWIICDLLTKLTAHGQAILCTIHQPSAMLFERFDRLLFLAKGGKTIYFGEVGEQSKILRAYFERNGGYPCPPGENPAEWMLSVIGAAPGSHSNVDWHTAWLGSPERAAVREELAEMKRTLPGKSQHNKGEEEDPALYKEFTASLTTQMREVTKRVFQQYWRTPSYIYSKVALCTLSALFIGFTFFKADNSQQGLQNQLFAIFMLFTIFGQLVQQIMPHFVTQRSLYEVRERPSKTYSWKVFMASNIFVELPWNSLMAVVIYFCLYYPVGLYRNAEPTNAVTERGGLFFLYCLVFLLFTSTFTNMVIAAIETAETGGNIANLLFSLTLIFNGVLASKDTLPGFWIFMYRVSPFTYLAEGLLTTGVANTAVVCAANEFVKFQPAGGATCETYMKPYISAAGGYLQNPQATSDCSFCPISSTNTFLAAFNMSYANRWRNFGILWAYIVFNIFGAIFLYWLFRVPKKPKNKKEEKNDAADPSFAKEKEAVKTTSNAS